MTLFTVVDIDGVIELQQASAEAYAAARTAYDAIRQGDVERTAESEAAVVALQKVAKAADDLLVKAWTYCSYVSWVRPGDQVSDRGLVYAPEITAPDSTRVAVYTSSAAFSGACTWLAVGPEAAAHCNERQALSIAASLTRYARQAHNPPGFTEETTVTGYGHTVTVSESGVRIFHDGGHGSDPADATAKITGSHAVILAGQLTRFASREN